MADGEALGNECEVCGQTNCPCDPACDPEPPKPLFMSFVGRNVEDLQMYHAEDGRVVVAFTAESVMVADTTQFTK